MFVARESIISALEEMMELEEISTANLAEVTRYDFSFFGPEGEQKIRDLLESLKEDTNVHRQLIGTIIRELGNE